MQLTSINIRPEHCDPLFLCRELGKGRDYCALLESADRAHGTHDFSFVALGARDVITVRDGHVHDSKIAAQGPVRDPLEPFESIIGDGSTGRGLEMGYIGYLSYESVRQFESIDLPAGNMPDAVFFLPEVLLRIDHVAREVTMIAHTDTQEDLEVIEHVVHTSPFKDDSVESAARAPQLNHEDIAPHRRVSREEHCERIEKAKESIAAGEMFQVVLSQDLVLQQDDIDPLDAYEELRRINPSPYMYYWRTPEMTIVGASPETLIRVEERQMLYRPIAGTRKRTQDPEENKVMQEELLSDQKERCEHQMLVDLGRNDVGRVAEIGSVRVENPFHIEAYSHVYHIVSDVIATLDAGKSPLDAVRSVFPAGTLTGAPKVRAMETIRDLEQRQRGIYGGAFGYIDLRGNLDLAITIRTMLFRDGHISMQAGGGIVADSVPHYEDAECMHKARACFTALAAVCS